MALPVLIFFAAFANKQDSDFFREQALKPVRDDSFAQKFCPQIKAHPQYGSPYRMLYRLGIDNSGGFYLACHPVYEKEENPHEGFLPLLSRLVYTGGLSLQKIIFGPEDVELIEVRINQKGEIYHIGYEDAENYNPTSFSVKHRPLTLLGGKPPLCFGIRSWNHMVYPLPAKDCRDNTIKVEYFSEGLWKKYRMFKEREGFLRKSRRFAYPWEPYTVIKEEMTQ
ncbi:MAG: hypothetical protein NZM25_10445 [Leptospiraceae bacterium]|nr:hypothetical protein [Leptospiraceae bacterium]MDW8305846.1 hypothetical protein [Leptospiraceae bacterium]